MSTEQSRRARLSLDGLSVGDGFGQRFFFPWVVEQADRDHLPEPPWHYTDDTEMAMALIEVLEQHGEVHQDELALAFARRFAANPGRGYGGGAIELLKKIHRGDDWRIASRNLFGGTGSFGNGGAMRVAPLGAWFAEDVEETIRQARLSAEVTHAHPEGQAGAIAVALAAGWAYRRSTELSPEEPEALLPWVADHLEDCEVRRGIEQAARFSSNAWAFDVAEEVGCGYEISAQDTVPFCLWLASTSINDYCEALWTAARVGGDIDTNCAIIGGIVALNTGAKGIPDCWLKSREPLAW